MQNRIKSKIILKEINYLEKLPLSIERNMILAKLRSELEEKDKYFRFDYVKHHMNIDIYEIIGKDLYGHFKRLLDTMNENNVCDLDSLDLKKSAKYIVKGKLIAHGLLKEVKLSDNVNAKLYINPVFGLKNRVYVNKDLEIAFKDINKNIYGLDLTTNK